MGQLMGWMHWILKGIKQAAPKPMQPAQSSRVIAGADGDTEVTRWSDDAENARESTDATDSRSDRATRSVVADSDGRRTGAGLWRHCAFLWWWDRDGSQNGLLEMVHGLARLQSRLQGPLDRSRRQCLSDRAILGGMQKG